MPRQPLVHRLRLRDVAAQVVQPHQRAVMGLAVVISQQQLFGEPGCGFKVALCFGRGNLLRQRGHRAALALRALLCEPRVEVLAVVKALAAEQGAAARLQRIDDDALDDEQGIGAVDQLGAVVALEARDLLAQRLARVVGVGPQQGRGAGAGDARLQGSQRQQAGGAAFERPHRRAGQQDRGVAEQAHLCRRRRGAGGSAGGGA